MTAEKQTFRSGMHDLTGYFSEGNVKRFEANKVKNLTVFFSDE